MATAGAIIAVIGLAVSVDAAKAQDRAQDRQLAITASSDASERARKRRKAVRIQRIKSAKIEQAAINTGVSGSSGEFASVGALSTDFALDLGTLASRKETSVKSLSNARDIGKAKVKSAVGSSLQSVGSMVIGANLKGSPELSVDQEISNLFDDPSIF